MHTSMISQSRLNWPLFQSCLVQLKIQIQHTSTTNINGRWLHAQIGHNIPLLYWTCAMYRSNSKHYLRLGSDSCLLGSGDEPRASRRTKKKQGIRKMKIFILITHAYWVRIYIEWSLPNPTYHFLLLFFSIVINILRKPKGLKSTQNLNYLAT